MCCIGVGVEGVRAMHCIAPPFGLTRARDRYDSLEIAETEGVLLSRSVPH